MYCSNCGKEIKDDAKFCPFCGNKTNDKYMENINNVDIENNINESKSKENKKSNPLFGVLIGVAGAALLVLALFFAGIITIDGSKSSTIEGKGFSSPEDALASYMNYFINQDVDGMMSCFAIESFVENVDYNKYLEDIGGGTFVSGSIVPTFGSFSNDILCKKRIGDLSNRMYYQYLFFAMRDDKFEDITFPFTLNDYDYDANKFINEMFAYTDDKKIKSLLNCDGEFIDYKALIDDSTKFDDYIGKKKERYGAEDVKPTIIRFDFDNESYIMCADAVKYNGSWYLCDFGGLAGSYLGIDTIHAGIEKLDNIK